MNRRTEHISPDIVTLLEKESCIGVVMLNRYAENIRAFREVTDPYRFTTHIHTVMKTNTSRALLECAKREKCRVDVSSLGELEKALSVGYAPENIIANGPKNELFLNKCVEEWITVIADSICELQMLGGILVSLQKKQKILIRLSGFSEARSSRFWVFREFWKDSIEVLQKYREQFEVIGYSFHIDIRDVSIRRRIFWESLEYYKLLREAGFPVRAIDIGGGFGADYHDDTEINCAICSRFHLGSRLYPQGDESVGPAFLHEFLEHKSDVFDTSISKFLEENGMELWIEPWRSLLSWVGYVATRVISVRWDSVVLDANSFSLGMREEELPTDPFVYDPNTREICEHEYFLLGNLCLESDIFFSRSVRFARDIRVGDIIVFPDVGAYHMDFYETESISHPKKSRYFQSGRSIFPDSFF